MTSGSLGSSAIDPPSRGQRALFRERDDVLDHAAHLLGARLGRLDPLVAQHGHDEARVQRLSGTGLAAELAPVDAVGHD